MEKKNIYINNKSLLNYTRSKILIIEKSVKTVHDILFCLFLFGESSKNIIIKFVSTRVICMLIKNTVLL